MKEFFVLVPHAKNDADKLAGWVLHDESNVEPLSLSLAELAAQKPERVTLVVPVNALAWHLVNVPVALKIKSDSRLLPALQGLLEDRLLDEADNAHIALAPSATSGAQALAMVCDRTWLHGWVKAFAAASIRITRIAPEVDPSMLEAIGQGVISTGHNYTSYASFADDGSLCTFPLPDGGVFVPAEDQVHATAAAHSDSVAAFGENRVHLLADLRFVELLRQSKWDMAQHDLAITGLNRIKKQAALATQAFVSGKQWRAARFACIAIAAVYGLGNSFMLYQSNQSLTEKQALVHEKTRNAFPNLTVLIDPVLQAKRELATLKRQQGMQEANDFLPLVTAAGAALGTTGSKPSSLEYADKALVITGLNDKDAPGFISRLQDKGYAAVQSSNSVRLTASN